MSTLVDTFISDNGFCLQLVLPNYDLNFGLLTLQVLNNVIVYHLNIVVAQNVSGALHPSRSIPAGGKDAYPKGMILHHEFAQDTRTVVL